MEPQKEHPGNPDGLEACMLQGFVHLAGISCRRGEPQIATLLLFAMVSKGRCRLLGQLTLLRMPAYSPRIRPRIVVFFPRIVLLRE